MVMIPWEWRTEGVVVVDATVVILMRRLFYFILAFDIIPWYDIMFKCCRSNEHVTAL